MSSQTQTHVHTFETETHVVTITTIMVPKTPKPEAVRPPPRNVGTEMPPLEAVMSYFDKSPEARQLSIQKLKQWKADENTLNEHGMEFHNHHMKKHTFNTRIPKKCTLVELLTTPEAFPTEVQALQKAAQNSTKPMVPAVIYNWVFHHPVTMFKASTAKWFYTKYGGTHVLDPTAGWGGRLLGAWATGLAYTGFDTNVSLKEPYAQMVNDLPQPKDNVTMHWENCLAADWSAIDYDLVLTSPPYINTELYEHMSPFASDEAYFKEFLIPLIDKARASIRRAGAVGINISSKLYTRLLSYGYAPAHVIEFYTSVNSKGERSRTDDMIYVWK